MTVTLEDLAYTVGGGRKRSPFDTRRSYGMGLMQQSMSGDPIINPAQGIARLAQAVMGGFIARRADEDEADREKLTREGLAQYAAAPDDASREAALKKVPPEFASPILMRQVTEQAKLREQGRQLEAAGKGLYTGYGIGPQSQPQAMPPAANGPAPPGFANNSGNIRASNAAWNGKGDPYNGFETFPTPLHGANAHFGNLQAYARQNPNMTVAQAIATWAPKGDGNNDPAAYMNRVTQLVGIDGNTPLAAVLQNPQIAARLMQGMTVVEKGGLPQGFTPEVFLQAANGQRPPAIPQGDSVPPQPQTAAGPPGAPPQPNPSAATMPTVVAPPQITDVPRPQPTPQLIDKHRQLLLSGAYGMGPEAQANARKAIDAEIDREWEISRQRARAQDERAYNDWKYNRERTDKQPQENFSNASKLRDDFKGEPAVKAYREVVPILESATDAMNRPSRAADLNLIYALGKIMDPNSVVREGEMVMARGTGTVQDTINGLLGQLNGAPTLTPETRRKLVEEMRSRFVSLEASHDTIADVYRGIAQRSNLNADDIVIPVRKPGTQRQVQGGVDNTPSQEELQRFARGNGPVRIQSDADYDRLPSGTTYTAPDGTTRRKP